VIQAHGAYHSPSTYSNPSCYLSQLVDIKNLFVGPGAGAGVRVDWAGEAAATKDECENQRLAVDVYDSDGAGGFKPTPIATPTAKGSWTLLTLFDGSVVQFCGAPSVVVGMGTLPGEVLLHHDYRFAVTARFNGAARPFAVMTENGVQ
jgi:hypothetical protein